MKTKHEFKTDEGWKVSVEDGLILVENDIEKKKEFKRGDILFKKDKISGLSWVIIFNERISLSPYYSYLAMYLIQDNELIYNSFADNDGWFYANKDEREIILNALSKDGKRWNEETKELEDIDQRILVPKCIKIYRWKKTIAKILNVGDRLLISFNDNIQLLGYANNAYIVDNYEMLKDYLEEIDCELIKCKREDLKAGDTAFMENKIHCNMFDISNYCKILDDESICLTDGINVYVTEHFYDEDRNEDDDITWYKIVPIKD